LLVWGLETGLKDLADLIDLATSFGGIEFSPFCLLKEDE
tara:strand:+ start:672 stop:788 length:117 start_codon:yes stop_codon:yes gene_type:complete